MSKDLKRKLRNILLTIAVLYTVSLGCVLIRDWRRRARSEREFLQRVNLGSPVVTVDWETTYKRLDQADQRR
jgi:hypothetical protein